ncbi:tyrosine-type recombinase/integrase [Chitinilyticum litopenaei]|uniref:tyrosine-type recombinase/integrase n=1 Tax=Chitinilyticum litopenaei TaxID=1121276 RepID=UPI0004011E71|nr:tyrosine-type recombinase/integrase [Chitinilyticum litopenaei]
MGILSDLKARTIKPGDPALAHGGITGLTLIPNKTKGSGKWVLRYVSPVTGKRRNMGLGSYPDVGIAAAGKLAQGYREQLAAGIDPLETRTTADQHSPRPPTFREAATTLHGDLLLSWKNEKHGQQWINTLTQYVFPALGSLPIDTITAQHVADSLKPIWLAKAETASRVKQRMHAVFAWGWAHGFIAANPVDVVKFLLPQQPGKALRTQHQPAMPWRQVPRFVAEHLHQEGRETVTRRLLEFLILTACRSGEVREARWEEINFDACIWTIPASRMKAKLEHVVPLSSQVVELLRKQLGMDDVLIFPSPRKNKPCSDMVLTSYLRRIQAESDIPGRTATAHGFRSSFRDWCSANRYDRDLAELALAHTISNKVEGAYNRERLLELRRPMMQAWADFVDAPSMR